MRFIKINLYYIQPNIFFNLLTIIQIIMQISVKNIAKGQSLTLKINSNMKILDIKYLIAQKLDLTPQQQVLIFAGKPLSNQILVSQSGIENKSTCFLALRLNGGGCIKPILFSNLQKPLYKQFSQQAPSYREIGKGLNLEGICQYLSCSLSSKKVWCKKGFGKFVMNKQLKTTLCPECHQVLKNIENMGLYLCKATIQGVKEDSQKVFKVYQAKVNKLLTFENKASTKCEWAYLEMNIEPLK